MDGRGICMERNANNRRDDDNADQFCKNSTATPPQQVRMSERGFEELLL